MKSHVNRIPGKEEVLVVLDNGVQIRSKSSIPGRICGDFLSVHDRDGYEIGYWTAQEWADDPHLVIGAVLVCAVEGQRWKNG